MDNEKEKSPLPQDMNSDDALLQQFFRPAREQQIADNGFTERVMRQLPPSQARLQSRLWTAFCLLVGMVLFVACKGWTAIATAIEVFLHTAPAEYHPLTIIVCVSVLAILAINEMFRKERWAF